MRRLRSRVDAPASQHEHPQGSQVETSETRPPPTDGTLVEAAQQQPGGWAYDVDRFYPENQRVPPEAIRGAWKVDELGKLTSHYMPNARYRAVSSCDRELKPYMHRGARTNPSRWIVEIDARGEALFPDIPPGLVRGWWYVDDQGKITNQFRPNSLWKG